MSLSNLKASHLVLNSHISCIDRGTEVFLAVVLAVFSENGPFVLMLFQKLDRVTYAGLMMWTLSRDQCLL